MEGLAKCSVNYVPLSPISFLERSAVVYRDRTSIVYGEDVKYNWGETYTRCVKLASALNQLGISRGDVVSIYLSLLFFFLIQARSTWFEMRRGRGLELERFCVNTLFLSVFIIHFSLSFGFLVVFDHFPFCW